MSIEQAVKAQFAKVFRTSDWSLFKKIAEANLRGATALKKADMPIESSLRLLARNARKRLLIGVGIELLLKAVYLKNGYCINKPKSGSSPKFPFTEHEAAGALLADDYTFPLNTLIDSLPKVTSLQDKALTVKGLRIAKIFRNKEGHGVSAAHAFDASNYRDIESSLVELYRDVFSERLSVHFSLGPKEKAVWRVTRPRKSLQPAPR